MNRCSISLATIVFLLVGTGSSPAQIDLSTVLARAGVIRTLDPSHQSLSESRWTFYPEVEIGGRFFASSLSWGVSWGYWDDDGDNYSNYADKSHIVAVRLSFLPQVLAPHWLIPLKLSGGVAEHFIYRDRVGIWMETASSPVPWRQEGAFQSTTLFAGLGLSFNLSSTLRLEAEAVEHFPVSDQPPIDYEQEYRLAFTLGVAYAW